MAEKRLPSVELHKEIHQDVKTEAKTRGWTVKEFVNMSLDGVLQKRRLIKKLIPNLELVGIHDGKLVIRDSEKKSYIGVFLNEKKSLYCEVDKSSSCIHVMFAWSLPEITQLDPKK